MRILTTILCLALLTLSACYRSTERSIDDQAYLDMFEGYSTDSLRRALERGDMTTEEEMVASGKLGVRYVAMARYDSAHLFPNVDFHFFDEQCVYEGSGLRNIRDRVNVFNGKIDIASAPGKGTETNIELSIKNA
jgi:hypothetical protein